MSNKPVKTCPSCGRDFEWRRKWAANWDEVRYCSERCRRKRVDPIGRQLESRIIELLRRRNGTICPSEAARSVRPDDWRPLMEDARAAGRRLAAAETVVFLKGGRRIDPTEARGAIRLGRGPAFGQARD